MSCIQYVILNGQVIENKICRKTFIGHDAAYLSGSHKNIFGFFDGKKFFYGLLVTEVKFF